MRTTPPRWSLSSVLPVLLYLSTSALAANATFPTVHLDDATVMGSPFNNVSQFLGIPYAQPAVGDLRFNLPQPVAPYSGNIVAQEYGPACPQQSGSTFNSSVLSALNLTGIPSDLLSLFGSLSGGVGQESEDCLSINVISPVFARLQSKLPVVVWIYGGGFESGATSSYNGTGIVERSIALDEPIIYVSMNYRVSALGFLASKEIKAAGAGNVGIQDQRLALKWVQKYISAFGGDPQKVTIWGQSAGSVSVGTHLVANGGNAEGLFRAAFMESGSPSPNGDITDGQPQYDAIVSSTNCTGASDTLACLRAAPFEAIQAAMDVAPSIFSYETDGGTVWRPRVDGVLLTQEATESVIQGKIAPVPFIAGDCDDEGTAFALPTLNITNTDELQDYLQEFVMPNATLAQVQQLLVLYPQNITQGSPFDTGINNALTPEYKRIAAITGDLTFQALRRLVLEHQSRKQKTWSYLSKQFKSIPVLGSAHGTDLPGLYGSGVLGDYLIHFVNYLNPNGQLEAGANFTWPQYTPSSPQLLTLSDGDDPLSITLDTYRLEALNFVKELFAQKLIVTGL